MAKPQPLLVQTIGGICQPSKKPTSRLRQGVPCSVVRTEFWPPMRVGQAFIVVISFLT